jgi:hypothetical protein
MEVEKQNCKRKKGMTKEKGQMERRDMFPIL